MKKIVIAAAIIAAGAGGYWYMQNGAGSSASANILDNDNLAGSINAVLSLQNNGSENNTGVTTNAVALLTISKVNNTGTPITFDLNINNLNLVKLYATDNNKIKIYPTYG